MTLERKETPLWLRVFNIVLGSSCVIASFVVQLHFELAHLTLVIILAGYNFKRILERTYKKNQLTAFPKLL